MGIAAQLTFTKRRLQRGLIVTRLFGHFGVISALPVIRTKTHSHIIMGSPVDSSISRWASTATPLSQPMTAYFEEYRKRELPMKQF
jgi:hypothetical protein